MIMDSDKILYYAGSADEIIEELEKLKPGIQGRINATPDNVESGLAKLVLTLIELIRKLIEKQAMRRIDGNSLSESQIEELGETLMKLEKKMEELKGIFNLTDKDLNLNLGPLGDLM
ncbi:MAG: gas vesicle protein K [Pelodictyon phaeoclathratiforme]|nr:gas vesicle protein K [Pelodictyon phaeoclathratiforme]